MHFLPPAGCGSIFPAKSCQDAWSGSRLVSGHVNMANEAKLHRPICSIFEVLTVWHGHYCGEELGPFISLICWAYFSDIMVSLGFIKLQWIRPAADHQTVSMTFFSASLALGSALELLLSPATKLVVASCLWNPLFVTHQANQEMVYCCCIE